MKNTMMQINPAGTISFDEPSRSYSHLITPWLSTSLSAPISALWNERFADLRRLRGLENDWDGEGAAAIDAGSILAAEGILAQIQSNWFELPPSRVDALANGGVLVIWNGEDSGYFEAEISSPTRVAVMYMPKHGLPQQLLISRDEPSSSNYVAASPAVKPASAISEQIYRFGT